MRHYLFFLFVIFCISLQSQSRYYFILDGSGSMWQKVEGEFKIAIAKEVMKNLVDELPAESEVGLVAYGHREKSDCGDIEILQSLSPLDKNILKEKIESINPMGKTPIAGALDATIDALEKENQKATIVLLSDGLETCAGDACAIVESAKAAGLVISTHVIGFALEEDNLQALECIAQAGGGSYFAANNADELMQALIRSTGPPAEGGGFLAVKVMVEGALADAIVKIYPENKTNEIAAGRTYTGVQTNPRIMRLPAGKYWAQVDLIRQDGNIIQKVQNITISEADTILKNVEFGEGLLNIKITRDKELSDAIIKIYKKGEKKTVASGRTYRSNASNPKRFKLPPGTYDIEVKSVEIAGDPVVYFKNQVISSSAPTDIEYGYESGILKLGVQKGTELVDAIVKIKNTASGKPVDSGRTYKNANSNPKAFVLAPGNYTIEITPLKPKGLAKKTIGLKVDAGKEVEKIVNY